MLGRGLLPELGGLRLGLLRADRIPRAARAGRRGRAGALAAPRARRASATARRCARSRLTALYWDFVALVWVAMYLAIYWL